MAGKITIFLLFLEILYFKTAHSGVVLHNNDEKLDWWQKAVFYQIYPRSFKDSDNDGVGDLQGIIQKINHFVDIGVNAIWLSPIYKSPMVDGGYDISDYQNIAPEYGTLEDFMELLKIAHENGLKVILDFVPNHTSNEHEWFAKSIAKEAGYEDYYFWADGKVDKSGNRIPPNNWLSVWRESGWEWNDIRQQYYFHQFSSKQPDLNFRNEKVQDEMKNILKFWLDLGVDGFRVDAVPHIYEDDLLRDEPINPDGGSDPNDYNYLSHIYTKDQPDTYELVYAWRDYLDNYTRSAGGDTRIFMTECATDLQKVVAYYGTKNGSRLGAHFSFNFNFLGMYENSRPADVKNAINAWYEELPSIYTFNWLTGNHDNHRVGTRVSPRNIDGYNMLLAFLPGITITYMGEEIGQEDGEVTCDQGQDPSAIGNCTTFNQTSRDFERTPFQWDDTANAGFNDGASTWLPVSKKYKKTNLVKEIKETKSHYHVYKDLLQFKLQIDSNRSLEIQDPHVDVLQVIKNVKDEQGKEIQFDLLFNMGLESVHVQADDSQSQYTIVISSLDSKYKYGEIIDGSNINLGPGDSIIIGKEIS